MKNVVIYLTAIYDIAQRIGAWAALLTYQHKDGSVGSKGFYEAANGKIEKPLSIVGTIAVLRLLKEPCKVTIVTDVGYLAHSFRYLHVWQKNTTDGTWHRKDGEKVVHQWLWERLLETIAEKGHHVSFNYCKNQEIMQPVINQARIAISELAEKNFLAS